MKKLILLIGLLSMAAFIGCNKDDAKREAANFFAKGAAPAVAKALNCDGGDEATKEFLQEILYSKLKVTKKGVKEFETLKAQKSVGGSICRTAMSYLQSEVVSWSDAKLSPAMRAQKCSMVKLADGGYNFLISKCPE